MGQNAGLFFKKGQRPILSPYIINQIAHQNYQQNNYNQILKQTHFTKIHTQKKEKKEKKARGVNQIYSRITPTHTLR